VNPRHSASIRSANPNETKPLGGCKRLFQRVFVGYQKFLPWCAKSYLMSGECFQKLGKTQEAINTYHEMLRNPKLEQLPEAETARQRLKELGEV